MTTRLNRLHLAKDMLDEGSEEHTINGIPLEETLLDSDSEFGSSYGAYLQEEEERQGVV
jgi:hypothetical protein